MQESRESLRSGTGAEFLDIAPGSVKRVLIYRLGSLGDTIVALPALHLVERTFPSAQRLMLTNIPAHAKAAASSVILSGSCLVHSYISYPVGTRSIRGLARVWWQIRRFRPDLLVYLASSRSEEMVRRDLRFFRLCGIRRIAGLPLGNLANNCYNSATDLWEQEGARLLRCLRPLGEADANDLRNWDLRLTEAERAKAREVLAAAAGRQIVACGPGTKMQAKDWGQQNWRALLDKLSAALPNHALVLVGAKEDAAASKFAAAGWKSTVLNLCGKLTPRETAAVLAHAELFVGPDSGPMHLAAISGVPCAIAFAARDYPGRWFPAGIGHRIVYHRVECFHCRLEVCIEKKKDFLTSITVEEMFAAAIGAWENGQRERTSRMA